MNVLGWGKGWNGLRARMRCVGVVKGMCMCRFGER